MTLRIDHNSLGKQNLMDFFASNTINAFFYSVTDCQGISNTLQYALAAQRPIAITKCGPFRSIFQQTPSIFVEDSSLQQIIANGIAPLVPYYNDWSEAAFILNCEQILGDLLQKNVPRK